MESAERRGSATHSSDSSAGEPAAVRRRISLDGSFTGSDKRRPRVQQSPASKASYVCNAGCDALLGNRVVSGGSGDAKWVSAGSSNTPDVAKRRKPSDQSNASGSSGEVQIDVVDCQTSESSKLNGYSETSETVHGGSSRGEASDSSINTDIASATDPKYLSSPFGGSRCSLQELELACLRVTEALDDEKKREESVVSVVSEGLSNISRLACKFYTAATVHFGKLVSRVENRDLRGSDVCCDEFEKRLDAVKAYVHSISNEAGKETCRSPVSPILRDESASNTTNVIEDNSSDEDQRLHAIRVHLGLVYPVRRASNSIRKTRNVVVRQRKAMTKMCSMAQQLESKAKVSCQLILRCMKVMVSILTPAVGSCMLMDLVVRVLDRRGQSMPEFKIAANFAAHWTSEALLDAERAVRIHKDAREALKEASRDLDVMRGYEPHGARVLRNVLAAGDILLEMVRQSDVSLTQVRIQESKMKRMKHSLTPTLTKMRRFRVLIEQYSAMCSDTLSIILRTLSVAIQSSSNAIEGATRAVEDIFIPASIPVEERQIYRLQMELLFK